VRRFISDFRGKPNDGTIHNFKSAIYLDKIIHLQSIYQLLIEQTNCTGIAYFWEQDKTVNSHLL
jgi:hypothetical protein